MFQDWARDLRILYISGYYGETGACTRMHTCAYFPYLVHMHCMS